MNEIKFNCCHRGIVDKNLMVEKSHFAVENKHLRIEIWRTTSNNQKITSLANVTAVKVTGLIHESNISEFKLNFPYVNKFEPCDDESHWNKSSILSSTYFNDNPNELECCLNKFINKFLTKKEKPIFTNLIESFINPLEGKNRLRNAIIDPSLPVGVRKLSAKLLNQTPSMMINYVVEKLISDSYNFIDFDNELKADEILEIRSKLQDELFSDLKKAGCSQELIFEAMVLLYPDDFPKENL